MGSLVYNQWIRLHNRIDLTGAKYQHFNCSRCSVPGQVLKRKIKCFTGTKKSLESNRLQEQRTSCQERKGRKGNTFTTMLISSFANQSCIPKSRICCLFSGLCCSNIQVYAVWNMLVPTAPLWGQGRSLYLLSCMNREVTARRNKYAQALNFSWAEREASVQGVGWEGVERDGREPSPAGPLLPLSTTRCPFAGTAVLGAEQENELSCFLSCRDFNSLGGCSPSRAVHGRQRIRLGF